MGARELINRLRDPAPLTPDERLRLVDLLHQKKYGLVWEDKPEALEEQLRHNTPVLHEVKGRAILNGSDHPDHLLIEGDNLHALTALTFTHEGKIDVIYIDPPYNTGNKDFKYNDSFVDREDSYRHSKWLSFMHKRLQLAKRLLSEKGVIFISIDDNEQAQLKLLCDEVFGEENFLADVIWEKNDSPKMDSRYFSVRHDYILCYVNNLGSFQFNQLIVSENDIAHYNKYDEDGRRYYTKPLRAMGGQGETREARPSLYYPIMAPDGNEVYPKRKDGSDGAWRWSKEKVASELERIEWTKGKNGYTPYFRIYAENARNRPVETVWPFTEVGSNRISKSEINNILKITNSFTTPKPVKLLDRILKIASSKESIVLDFFAGSGTTLHATMQLNAEDGGNRQCILVTNNENNICEEVTYERNRRVIQGYTNAKGQQVPGLTHNNLRYYTCGFVPGRN